MKLLQIDSSACSASRRLTAGFAEEWQKNHPQGQVICRDLLATVFPSVTDGWAATHLRRSRLTPEQRCYLSTSDELIEELRAADTVVIGAPMHKLCKHVLLRLVNTGQRLFLDLRGMTYLALDTSQLQEANG